MTRSSKAKGQLVEAAKPRPFRLSCLCCSFRHSYWPPHEIFNDGVTLHSRREACKSADKLDFVEQTHYGYREFGSNVAKQGTERLGEIMNFDQLFGNTGDGVYVVDVNGIVQYWSASAEKILGYSAQEVVGKRCYELLNGRDAACNRICRESCAVQMQASEREPINHFEMSSTTSTGKAVWLDVSIINVLTGSDNPPAIVHLVRDATVSHDIETIVREKFSHTEPNSNGGQPSPAIELTAREREVLGLMKQGASTTVTAEKLFISRATVRNHIQNIFSKLGVHTRLEAVAYINGHRS